MKFPGHSWFEVKASNLVDLNKVGWLAMDLFKKKSSWWSFKLRLILWSFEDILFIHELNVNLWFHKILRKEDMGTNLQRTWKEEFLNKEEMGIHLEKIWEKNLMTY